MRTLLMHQAIRRGKLQLVKVLGVVVDIYDSAAMIANEQYLISACFLI